MTSRPFGNRYLSIAIFGTSLAAVDATDLSGRAQALNASAQTHRVTRCFMEHILEGESVKPSHPLLLGVRNSASG